MKRFLALILSGCMICTALPFAAIAEEEASDAPVPVSELAAEDEMTPAEPAVAAASAATSPERDDFAAAERISLPAPPERLATSEIYTYEVSNGEATITDCSTSAAGAITIPSTLGGYPVTSIGNYAFEYCRGLISITIPNSVTSIGDSAFAWCSGLTSVTIPNSVTSIGESAFVYCFGLTSIVIPDSVTSIGRDAFYGCFGLTSVIIPDSVTSIGDYAFAECSGLTGITIPASVTSIGDYAFQWCDGVASIQVDPGNSVYHSDGNCLIETATKTLVTGCKTSVIPADGSVTSIGEGAFGGCSGLTSITIPSSVTSIGNDAFADCSGLTGITIPNSVTSIGEGAFVYCSGLTSIRVAPGNSVYHSEENCIIQTATKILVAGCKTSVIPANGSVTSIGGSAFGCCRGLTSVTIPNSVTSIGEGAFRSCSGLTSITIPDSVTSIGGSAFRGCSGLTSVTIPDSVTSIGEGAFASCFGLTTVYYSGMEEQWNKISIEEGNEALENATVVFAFVLEESGVSVTGFVEDGAMLVVEEQNLSEEQIATLDGFEEETAKVFDLKLIKEEEATQPLQPVKVSILLPEGMDGKKTRVLHLAENGAVTDMNARYENGCMVFTTDHFSLFVLAERSFRYGDANGDGEITAADIVGLKNYFANLDYSTGISTVDAFPGADANGDGEITAADIVRLKNYFANFDYSTGTSTVPLGPAA